MKVYLAAPYSYKDQMNTYAQELRAMGIGVTSTWLEERHEPNIQMHELSPEEHEHYALNDVDDVCAADAMVFFTDPTKTITRGGRHVEFGMAVILETPILVVGDHENIFHHLPGVSHYKNWEQVKNELSTQNALFI